jgi:hypothetical protein
VSAKIFETQRREDAKKEKSVFKNARRIPVAQGFAKDQWSPLHFLIPSRLGVFAFDRF